MPKPGKRKSGKRKAKQKSKAVKLDEVSNKMDFADTNESKHQGAKIKKEPDEQRVEIDESFTMNFEEEVKTEEELEDKKKVWIQKIREIREHKLFEQVTDFEEYFDFFEEKAEISQMREFVENMQTFLQNFHCQCCRHELKLPIDFAIENPDFFKLLLDTKLMSFMEIFDCLFCPEQQNRSRFGHIEMLLKFATDHGIQVPNIEEYFEKACLAGALTAVDELVQMPSKMNLKLDLKQNLENTLRDFESVDEECKAYNRVGSVESMLRADIDYGEHLYQKSFWYACTHKHWKRDFKPARNAIEVVHSSQKGMWRRMDPYGGMRLDFSCVHYSR